MTLVVRLTFESLVMNTRHDVTLVGRESQVPTDVQRGKISWTLRFAAGP
jgi:hypothetical protein